MTQTLMRRMAQAQQRRAAKLARLWRIGGWTGVIVTLVLSLMPPTLGSDDTHIDKLAHLFGYAALMFWWAQLVIYQRGKLAVAVVLLGVAIEGLQGLTPDRLPDLFDALANTTGVLLGWIVARHMPNLIEHWTSLPAQKR